jgi:hypothetical protein
MLIYLPPVKDGPLLTVLDVPFMEQVNLSLLPLAVGVPSLALAVGTLLYAAHALGVLGPRPGPRRSGRTVAM